MPKPSGRENRISLLGGEGLLSELDLAELLDLPQSVVVDYIDRGLLPGCRIGPQRPRRVRTLTSIKKLIEFVENKSKSE